MLSHLHSTNETHYDCKRNCASGPFSRLLFPWAATKPSSILETVSLPWLHYSTPSFSPFGMFLFRHQNRCTLLVEEEELTGAGDEHDCSFGMCQQYYMNAEHDSSTSCLYEKLVGLKSCFRVNKSRMSKWHHDILSNKIDLPCKRS